MRIVPREKPEMDWARTTSIWAICLTTLASTYLWALDAVPACTVQQAEALVLPSLTETQRGLQKLSIQIRDETDFKTRMKLADRFLKKYLKYIDTQDVDYKYLKNFKGHPAIVIQPRADGPFLNRFAARILERFNARLILSPHKLAQGDASALAENMNWDGRNILFGSFRMMYTLRPFPIFDGHEIVHLRFYEMLLNGVDSPLQFEMSLDKDVPPDALPFSDPTYDHFLSGEEFFTYAYALRVRTQRYRTASSKPAYEGAILAGNVLHKINQRLKSFTSQEFDFDKAIGTLDRSEQLRPRVTLRDEIESLSIPLLGIALTPEEIKPYLKARIRTLQKICLTLEPLLEKLKVAVAYRRAKEMEDTASQIYAFLKKHTEIPSLSEISEEILKTSDVDSRRDLGQTYWNTLKGQLDEQEVSYRIIQDLKGYPAIEILPGKNGHSLNQFVHKLRKRFGSRLIFAPHKMAVELGGASIDRPDLTRDRKLALFFASFETMNRLQFDPLIDGHEIVHLRFDELRQQGVITILDFIHQMRDGAPGDYQTYLSGEELFTYTYNLKVESRGDLGVLKETVQTLSGINTNILQMSREVRGNLSRGAVLSSLDVESDTHPWVTVQMEGGFMEFRLPILSAFYEDADSENAKRRLWRIIRPLLVSRMEKLETLCLEQSARLVPLNEAIARGDRAAIERISNEIYGFTKSAVFSETP